MDRPDHHLPPTGGRAAASLADDPLAHALRDATADTHELLGEVGRTPAGVAAFLARRRATGALVVLRLVPDGTADGAAHYTVAEHRELDDAVPSPRDACRTCQVPIPGWGRRCAVCGSEEPVVIDGSAEGTTRAELLEAVRASTADRYEMLGDICRPAGGGPVYFARELATGQLTALRLLREGGGRAGATHAYALVAVPLLPAAHSGPAALPGTAGVPGAPAATGPVGVTCLFRDDTAGDVAGDAPSGDAPAASGTTGPTTGGGRATEPHAKVCPQCGATYPADVMFCPNDGAALRPIAATTSLIGQIVADRFHVLAKLGEGGMGEVYLAEHVQLGRRCAVKLMRQALTDDAEATARFRREAKNASEIAHPNIATVFDFGATSDGVTYLVMEYVDGEPLSSTLAREGPLEPARVAAIARQVAEALAAAHALGIVHRDLKPDNVMLAVGRDGRETVKVVDFGIAKAMEGVTQQVTRTGYRIGTPAYMSPEQIRGDTLDGRSDLYSLGCILFELLTGHPPFEGEVGEIVVGRRLTEQPPHPRDLDAGVPKALDEITVRLLARSPDDRFASAEELLATLAATPVGESGMWRLPFARRPARQTHTPTPRGITISGVEQRLPSGQLRTPPPVPLSPAVASPITVGTAAAPAAAASGVRRTPRDRRRHRPLVLASGGLLAVVAVAGVLLTYQDGDAPANATVASHDSLPAAAPGGVAPVPPAATRSAPSVSGTADPTAVDAAPSPATPSTRDTGSAIHDTPATRVPVTPPSPAPRPAPPRVTTAPRETAGAAAPDRSVAVVPTPPSAPTAPVSPPAAAPPTSSSPPAAGSPDSEAAAAAADRAGIQQVIGDYMRAFDARDAAAARRVYPDVDTRAWEARQLTNWSAKLVEQPAVTLRGATAEASFAYELAFFHPQTGMSRTTLAAHATLQRTAAGWRIQRLDAAPRR